MITTWNIGNMKENIVETCYTKLEKEHVINMKKNGQKQVRRLQQTYVEHVGKMTKTQRNIFFETAEIPNPQNMTKNR
jgi:hypothetical protein